MYSGAALHEGCRIVYVNYSPTVPLPVCVCVLGVYRLEMPLLGVPWTGQRMMALVLPDLI